MKFRVSRGPGGVPGSIIAVFGGGTGGLDPLNARALTWRRVTPGGRATDRGHGVPRGSRVGGGRSGPSESSERTQVKATLPPCWIDLPRVQS